MKTDADPTRRDFIKRLRYTHFIQIREDKPFKFLVSTYLL
jgi:hypothetical protein